MKREKGKSGSGKGEVEKMKTLTKPSMHGPLEMSEKTWSVIAHHEPPPLQEYTKEKESGSPTTEENLPIGKPEKAILRSSRRPCSSIRLSSPSQLSVNACCAPRQQVPASSPDRKMGISKSNRIVILLVIDSAFFLLELVAGKALFSAPLPPESSLT